MIWLQEYLNSFDTTLLVVAHDRDFVDNITQELIILRNRTLTYFDGNLTEYERNTREERKSKTKMRDALDRKKDAVAKTIENARRTAKKTGNDNLAKMAKSRQNKLDDRMGLERSAKGGRYGFCTFCVPNRSSSIMRLILSKLVQVQTQSRYGQLWIDKPRWH